MRSARTNAFSRARSSNRKSVKFGVRDCREFACVACVYVSHIIEESKLYSALEFNPWLRGCKWIVCTFSVVWTEVVCEMGERIVGPKFGY